MSDENAWEKVGDVLIVLLIFGAKGGLLLLGV